MDYTNSDPNTLSTPLYSGSQSPLKVPPTGVIHYPCVPSSSECESSQSEAEPSQSVHTEAQQLPRPLRPTLD